MTNAELAQAFITKHCPRCCQMTTHRVVHGEGCLVKLCMICTRRGVYEREQPPVLPTLQQAGRTQP